MGSGCLVEAGTPNNYLFADPLWARYSYLCPKLKLINNNKRREKRKKEEKGRVLTHKGII